MSQIDEQDGPPKGGADIKRYAIDIESLKLADEVGGWINKHKMGTAVLCAIDLDTEVEYVFSDDYMGANPLNKLYEFLNGNIIIGYNIKCFDLRLIQEELMKGGIPMSDFKIGMVDISRKRISLGSMTTAMFDDAKMMDGADAPKEWKKGGKARDKVVEYCMDDVKKTIAVLRHGLATGYIFYYDSKGDKKRLDVDWKKLLDESKPISLEPDCLGGYKKAKKSWQCSRCPFKRECIGISR